MTGLIVALALLVILGSTLALAEASLSRVSVVRALVLREEGHRNAALLEEIERDPARFLNAVYLSVMFAQNGSAILAALLAQRYFGGLGVTLASVAFTLGYFVVVEAMSKTFAILHSDRVALALAPLMWVLGRGLSIPTRLLIGLANVLLPGKGLAHGPFVSEQEIRSMADVGHREGVIAEHAKEMIHSVFEFGERVVRDVMVPRPDVVALDIGSSLEAAADLVIGSGKTRIPLYRGDLDRTEGILHARDVLRALYQARRDQDLAALALPVRFVPESKRLSELMREMREERFHLAMVTDEYGSVAGVVTLEDLLEELVGQIRDEHEREAPDLVALGAGRWRVNAALPIVELNEQLGIDLPHDRWNTVGGLIFGLAGTIPPEGTVVEMNALRFVTEKVQGRRIVTAIIEDHRS